MTSDERRDPALGEAEGSTGERGRLADWWAGQPVAVQRVAKTVGGSALSGGAAWTTSVSTVMQTVAIVAVALGLFQLVNSIFRRRAGHWGKGLRGLLVREFILGALLMIPIAAICLVLDEHWWAPALVAVLLLLAWWLYVDVEAEIQNRVSKLHLPDGTSRVGQVSGKLLSGNSRTLKDTADEAAWIPHKVLGYLLSTELRKGLSPTRHLIATALLALFFAAGAAAVTSPFRPVEDDKSDQRKDGNGEDNPGKPEKAKTLKFRARVAPTESAQASPELAKIPLPAERQWLDVCGALPGTHVQAQADKQILMMLYLGIPREVPTTDEPPGADQAGCDGPAVTPSGQDPDLFKYVIGTRPTGETRSIAALSDRFGPAIFLAPAVDPVEALVDRYRDVGGLRRTDLGSGDIYGVRTPDGGAILLRPTKTTNSTKATAYLVLLPAAARAWLLLLREEGRMLWPAGNAGPDGVGRFDFSIEPGGDRVVHTFDVDISGRVQVDGGQSEGPGGGEIDQATLNSIQAVAPPSTP